MRDILLETAIAVSVVTGGLIYVARNPRERLNWDRIAVAGNSVVVFGFLISWFRQEWRRLVFWAALGALLMGHTAVYLFVIGRVHDIPLAFYVVLNAMELGLFTAILRKLLSRNED